MRSTAFLFRFFEGVQIEYPTHLQVDYPVVLRVVAEGSEPL